MADLIQECWILTILDTRKHTAVRDRNPDTSGYASIIILDFQTDFTNDRRDQCTSFRRKSRHQHYSMDSITIYASNLSSEPTAGAHRHFSHHKLSCPDHHATRLCLPSLVLVASTRDRGWQLQELKVETYKNVLSILHCICHFASRLIRLLLATGLSFGIG
jgi:hypothetical protein